MSLTQHIESHEGFREKPYIDPLVAQDPEKHGIPKNAFEICQTYLDKLTLTFGYGFTFLTKEEAESVLNIRLNKISKELNQAVAGYSSFPIDVQQMLTEMAYQMGVGGVQAFRNMLDAIRNDDWCRAFAEGKDSRWYLQTPSRALEVLLPLSERCQN